MASRAKAKPPKKRQQRATSNIFAMFDQSQIQEYKEAFNIIDHDRVYFIDEILFVLFFFLLLGWFY
jgi:Ca2+-binding EF-hand superfamily protein